MKHDSPQRGVPGVVLLPRHRHRHAHQQQPRRTEPAEVVPQHLRRRGRPAEVGFAQPARATDLPQKLQREEDLRRLGQPAAQRPAQVGRLGRHRQPPADDTRSSPGQTSAASTRQQRGFQRRRKAVAIGLRRLLADLLDATTAIAAASRRSTRKTQNGERREDRISAGIAHQRAAEVEPGRRPGQPPKRLVGRGERRPRSSGAALAIHSTRSSMYWAQRPVSLISVVSAAIRAPSLAR